MSNSESGASAILNQEDEASLEFNGQQFDGTKLQERLPGLHDIDLFSLNLDEKSNSDSELSPFRPIRCKYYHPTVFINSKISYAVNVILNSFLLYIAIYEVSSTILKTFKLIY